MNLKGEGGRRRQNGSQQHLQPMPDVTLTGRRTKEKLDVEFPKLLLHYGDERE